MGGVLEGRRALVTGAGRGIGEAIAIRFAKQGADVVLAARSRDQLDGVKAQIEALGRKAHVVPTDMGDPEQVRALAREGLKAFGGLEIVVSNAGISGNFGGMSDTPFDTFRQVQKVNLEGPLILLQELGPALKKTPKASVIIVSSIRGLKGVPLGGSYAAGKAALNSLTMSLACEWGEFGVRVNGILPGPVETDIIKESIGDDPVPRDKLRDMSPLRRWAVADDCAGPAVFLASDDAVHITGQLLVVDGGLTIQSPEHFMV